MNLESLTVALRPRTAWEAVELGTALTRRHAAAIWKPWLLLTLSLLVLVNAVAWAIGLLWLAPLLMWWFKPAFDRIPLYVLSHAVFGDVPTTWQTLRAQWRWGARWLLPYLTWRRLSPVRALNLPIDLLEGGQGDAARQRRSTIAGPAYGVATLTTLICLHFELAVYFGIAALGFMFVPAEYLVETAHSFWEALLAQPKWIDLLGNVVIWLSTCLIEPFYVGAGFGLYLNRRTEIEGWDIEIVLRRLRARLATAATPLLLCIVLAAGFGLAALPVHAQDAPATPAAQREIERQIEHDSHKQDFDKGEVDEDRINSRSTARQTEVRKATLPKVFGAQLADDGHLRQAVERAYEDPSVSPKRTVTTWKPRNPAKPRKSGAPPPFLAAFGRGLAMVGEFGMWVLLGVLVVILLATSPRWIGWLRGVAAAQTREPDPVEHAPLADDTPLPDDIPAAARRLWQAGRQRDALALLYRASVETMSARAGVILVPGATEAACLRASRQMPEAADRDVFASMVRLWQYAAYAGRLPSTDAFESQLDDLSGRFGWTRRPTTGTPA